MNLEQVLSRLSAKGVQIREGGGTGKAELTSPEVAGILCKLDKLAYHSVLVWLMGDHGSVKHVFSELLTAISSPDSRYPVDAEHLSGVTIAIMQVMTQARACSRCAGVGYVSPSDSDLPVPCVSCHGARLQITSTECAHTAGITRAVWRSRRYHDVVRYWVRHLNALLLGADQHCRDKSRSWGACQ